jgi:hypothetical protein
MSQAALQDLYKTISLTPLTGMFDARTAVDSELAGSFAWKQNFEISPDAKLRHAHGFIKPYDINPSIQNIGGVPCPYKDWDFHGNGGFSAADREPPTLLFASETNQGARQLFLGTKTRIMLLDEAAGTWSTLGSGFGDDGTDILTQISFKAAELQDKVAFTNGFDPVQYYDLTASTFGVIPNLATATDSGGAVTTSQVVIEWQGVLFLMNNKEDGVQVPSRIRWSDLNNMLDWGQSDSSISDFQDLDYGENILGAVPMLGSLYVFTDKSIWICNFQVSTSPPSAVLNCTKYYTEPRNKTGMLAYPRTLVSTGLQIYYAGRDAIYEFDPYQVQPQRLEWIYAASGLIFDPLNNPVTAIDTTCCNSPCAEFHPDTQEIHFSWPTPQAVQVAGNNCDAVAPIQGSGVNNETLVLNLEYSTCDYRDYGSTALVHFQSDIGLNATCNQTILFLGANGVDQSLKWFGQGYAREIYNPASGLYTMTGYYPILRFVFPFGAFDAPKSIRAFIIDGIPDQVDTGTVFKLRLGASYKTVNPNMNNGNCGVLWKQFSSKEIDCSSDMTPEEYQANNILPTDGWQWNFLLRGQFLYGEITITMPDGTPATSGGVALSRFDVEAVQL